MTKLKIKVTKEILERSKMCGWKNGNKDMSTNCAIALAVRDVFPEARVGSRHLNYLGDENYTVLPAIASNFITIFDNLSPKERVEMSELEFEVEVPDEVIEKINIEELKPLLENHPTLQLIEN